MVSQVESQIFKCIENKESFVLDAGAGSGKTWTLVQTLNYLIETKSNELSIRNQKIVCITFTNVAKDEIIDRTEHNELVHVSTIHDFLWDCVKNFQKELKSKFIELIETKLNETQAELNTKTRKNTKIYQSLTDRISKYKEVIENLDTHAIKINYSNFPNYNEGVFSHDELIIIAEKIFSSYPKIGKIITDCYPIILVDEYQDTQEETVQILLNYLLKNKDFIVGFFGDRIQQIYDKGIGEIPNEYNLKLIKKSENYRSSKEVINLLNKLRSDIKQYQPPQNKRIGDTVFYYLPNPESFIANKFIADNLKNKWNLETKDDVKVLYLTHRYIAKENGYEELYQIHKNRDIITKNSDNRNLSPFTDFLFDIEEIIELFNMRKIQQFLKRIHYKVDSFKSKKALNNLMKELLEMRKTKNIGEVINFVIMKQLLPKSDRMKSYDFEDEEKKDFYDNLMKIDFSQFSRLYQVQQENTPFSTKHNTKGNEFDYVLIIIDDKSWKQNYNFNEFFSNNRKNEKRFKRTNNLFYVVCSRAKKNLAVVCVSDLSKDAKLKIQELFGEEKYHEINLR